MSELTILDAFYIAIIIMAFFATSFYLVIKNKI